MKEKALPHRSLALPDVLGLFGDKVADFGVDVAGRDGICTGKLNPFDGKGAALFKQEVSHFVSYVIVSFHVFSQRQKIEVESNNSQR